MLRMWLSPAKIKTKKPSTAIWFKVWNYFDVCHLIWFDIIWLKWCWLLFQLTSSILLCLLYNHMILWASIIKSGFLPSDMEWIFPLFSVGFTISLTSIIVNMLSRDHLEVTPAIVNQCWRSHTSLVIKVRSHRLQLVCKMLLPNYSINSNAADSVVSIRLLNLVEVSRWGKQLAHCWEKEIGAEWVVYWSQIWQGFRMALESI